MHLATKCNCYSRLLNQKYSQHACLWTERSLSSGAWADAWSVILLPILHTYTEEAWQPVRTDLLFCDRWQPSAQACTCCYWKKWHKLDWKKKRCKHAIKFGKTQCCIAGCVTATSMGQMPTVRQIIHLRLKHLWSEVHKLTHWVSDCCNTNQCYVFVLLCCLCSAIFLQIW